MSHQPKLTEHQRRQCYNAATPNSPETHDFVSPDNDQDLKYKFPFGKYKGMTLSQILEIDPGYIAWMIENVDLREGVFCMAIHSVFARYQDRIETASKFRRAERF